MFHCRMAVLNDFEACGYGVPALQPEDLHILNDVPARPKVSLQLLSLQQHQPALIMLVSLLVAFSQENS